MAGRCNGVPPSSAAGRRGSMTSQVMDRARRLGYRPRHECCKSLPVGALLRDWRQRRRLSQLDLAGEAGVSTRHLSFVETGRARPSREMVLRLAEQLDVPLRERNRLLLAAGYAPRTASAASTTRRWPRAPAPSNSARRATSRIRRSPSTATGTWSPPTARCARSLAGVDAELLEPPLNVLRLSLHPEGLAPRDRQPRRVARAPARAAAAAGRQQRRPGARRPRR